MTEVTSAEMFYALSVVREIMQQGADGIEPSITNLPASVTGPWTPFPSPQMGRRLMKEILSEVGGFLEQAVGLKVTPSILDSLIDCLRRQEANEDEPWRLAEGRIGRENVPIMMFAAIVLEGVIKKENALRENNHG